MTTATANPHASQGRGESYTVSAKSATRVLAEASSRVSPLELCSAVGLEANQLSDTACRIPLKQLVALYETAARMANDPAFGLRVGARADFRTFGVFGYIIMHSATLEESLKNAERYFPLWTNGAGFRAEREKAGMRFIWEYADPGIGDPRQDCEMTLLTAAKIGRSLLVPHRPPREVHFQHSAPRHSFEHRRLFGTSVVHFRMPVNQLIFDRDALASPLGNADGELCSVLVSYANDLLAHGGHRCSLAERTQMTLRRFFPHGRPQLTRVANSMGLSPRTLQRRLRVLGSSFRRLLDQSRRELAERYLHDPEFRISEVASQLGYAETSEFHRAFRAWTGTTPKRYRRLGAK